MTASLIQSIQSIWVYSLSCKTCNSQKSWEDCRSTKTNQECPSGSPNCFMGNLNCSNGINTTAMLFYRRCGIKGQACNTTYVPTCPPLKNGWDLSKFAGHCYMDKGENPTSGSSHTRAWHVQEYPFCWPSGSLHFSVLNTAFSLSRFTSVLVTWGLFQFRETWVKYFLPLPNPAGWLKKKNEWSKTLMQSNIRHYRCNRHKIIAVQSNGKPACN